ncbi:MAG: hypothetical protein KF873_23610 [Gemmataceae bacterium]|jgi:hypothetical protein|nr:hypothetical protein [Gemmataceae bacterium]
MTTPDDLQRVAIRRYATGKYYLYADTATEHAALVERALAKAGKVCICFEADIFRAELRGAGVLDSTIESYLDTVSIIDDVFGRSDGPG